jgi:hypothetical protein
MSDLDFSNARHPVWERYRLRWLMGFDFYRGGVHTMIPEYYRAQSLFRVSYSGTSEGDNAGYVGPEPLKPDEVMQWVGERHATYLFSHNRETSEEFRDRQRRVYNWSIFQWAVNILTSGVLKVGADRKGGNQEPWKTFWKDVDLNGTDIDHYVSHSLALALAFGRMHAIVDRPFFDEPAISLQDQIDRGERAYARMVTPLDLVDWSTDGNGRFRWIVIREDGKDEREPGDAEIAETDQYRVWYPDRWELYEEVDKPPRSVGGATSGRAPKYVKTLEGSHPAGRVPLATIYACRPFEQAPTMAVESPMADMLDLNRHVVNKLSEEDELERSQAFSLLTVASEGGDGGGELEIGPGRVLDFAAGTDRPDYVSPDAAHADGIFNRLKGKVFMARQMTPIGRGNAEFSMEERSSEALTNEKEDRNNWLATLAASCAEFEEDLSELVMAYDKGSPPTITYPRTYDVRGTMAQIQELQILVTSSKVLSREAEAALTKPIVSKKMKEHGKKEAEIAKIEKSIDDEASKPPPAPPPAFPPATGEDGEDGDIVEDTVLMPVKDFYCEACEAVSVDHMVPINVSSLKIPCVSCDRTTLHHAVCNTLGPRVRVNDFPEDPRFYRGQVETSGFRATYIDDETGEERELGHGHEEREMTDDPYFAEDAVADRRDRVHHDTDRKRGTLPLVFDRVNG